MDHPLLDGNSSRHTMMVEQFALLLRILMEIHFTYTGPQNQNILMVHGTVFPSYMIIPHRTWIFILMVTFITKWIFLIIIIYPQTQIFLLALI